MSAERRAVIDRPYSKALIGKCNQVLQSKTQTGELLRKSFGVKVFVGFVYRKAQVRAIASRPGLQKRAIQGLWIFLGVKGDMLAPGLRMGNGINKS